MASKVSVPDGYRCPLCPDHEDDVFFFSRIVDAPICQGCAIEITHFIFEDQRRDDVVLDRLEALTGLSFPEYKRLALEQIIAEYEDMLQPENAEREAQREMKATGRLLQEVHKGWRERLASCRETLGRLS